MPPPSSPLLVADIGGTNARLGLATWDAQNRQVAIKAIDVLRCADYPDIADLLGAYLQRIRHSHANAAWPQSACFAIAGPLQNNIGTLTNIGWQVDGDKLAQRLELNHVELLNDFGALASSVPFLGSADILTVRDNAAVRGPISVVGAGTGFGVALLVPNDNNAWDLVATEGGHVSFAPTSRREHQVWEFLGGYQQHVCVENILSGSGIVNIYHALSGTRTSISPDEISQRALAGTDPVSSETIDIFCDVFGSVAGNVALTHGARGGIYLGGGILPKLLPLFQRDHFIERFDDKGIMSDYVKAVPIRLITSEYPALTGAAVWFWQKN